MKLAASQAGKGGMSKVSREDLIAETAELLDGNTANLSLDRLLQLITIMQHATDVLLNEIERRGKLTFQEEVPVVPYVSDYRIKTILTRAEDNERGGPEPPSVAKLRH
ncbi:hypothetical protein E2C06_35255 [Dankookia rubra]|uniref:Uncharacterized protein n=1 Tax=Dankookia rubra TaxID=1442381 RepID=A0A4R5Q5C3_9PROT|nr:hypothetical protein [Dankookia rubra]TDH57936.1 hypothetical protein E2C06_35255 [Dankookia rubra]